MVAERPPILAKRGQKYFVIIFSLSRAVWTEGQFLVLLIWSNYKTFPSQTSFKNYNLSQQNFFCRYFAEFFPQIGGENWQKCFLRLIATTLTSRMTLLSPMVRLASRRTPVKRTLPACRWISRPSWYSSSCSLLRTHSPARLPRARPCHM